MVRRTGRSILAIPALRIILGAAILTLAFACGAAATPTPVPTIVPLAPPPTPTPAAGAVIPTATPRPAPTPTPVAVLTRSLIYVGAGEPLGASPVQREKQEEQQFTDALSDRLVILNPQTLEWEKEAAESYEQVDGDTWRFTIKKGMTFHNGNPVTAEAYAYNGNYQVVSENKTRYNRYGSGQKFTAIDEYTFQVDCPIDCPVLINQITNLHLGDPAVHQPDPTAARRTVPSFGPYQFVDWREGEYIDITFYDGYYGAKPQIKDVRSVWRKESAVRAAMVAVGEADLAWDIEAQNTGLVPKSASVESVETAVVKFDTRWNENTSNKEFRQALAYALDLESIAKNILGGQGGPAALPFHRATTGYDQTLKIYPYDPDKAKEIINRLGFQGSKVVLFGKSPQYTKGDEVAEAIQGYWTAVGLDVELQLVESEIDRQLDRQLGGRGMPDVATRPWPVGEQVPNARIHGHTNDILDPEATLGYLNCTQYNAFACYPQEYYEGFIKEALESPLPARIEKMKAVARWWHDELPTLAIHDIRPVYGMAKNLDWTPRPDWKLLYQTMRFTD